MDLVAKLFSLLAPSKPVGTCQVCERLVVENDPTQEDHDPDCMLVAYFEKERAQQLYTEASEALGARKLELLNEWWMSLPWVKAKGLVPLNTKSVDIDVTVSYTTLSEPLSLTYKDHREQLLLQIPIPESAFGSWSEDAVVQEFAKLKVARQLAFEHWAQASDKYLNASENFQKGGGNV